MICQQCGKPANHTEDFEEIPIGTCEDGHRTGKDLRPMLQPAPYEAVEMGWLMAEAKAWELIKKAS